MKKKIMWTGISLVVLAGLYALYVESFGSPSFTRISKAEKAVAAKMLDGETARFRNVRVIDAAVTCGEVNGKNQFGAYTGFTGFKTIGSDDDPVIIFEKDAASSYEVSCGRK